MGYNWEPRPSEANTQAEFYYFAKVYGLQVYLELKTPVGRIDAAVLRPDRAGIVAVVECKHDGRSLTSDTPQIRRYKRLGVPVYGLTEFKNAERLVLTIAKRHMRERGMLWSQLRAVTPLQRRRSLDAMAGEADAYFSG